MTSLTLMNSYSVNSTTLTDFDVISQLYDFHRDVALSPSFDVKTFQLKCRRSELVICVSPTYWDDSQLLKCLGSLSLHHRGNKQVSWSSSPRCLLLCLGLWKWTSHRSRGIAGSTWHSRCDRWSTGVPACVCVCETEWENQNGLFWPVPLFW